jgi:hypothetical protein
LRTTSTVRAILPLLLGLGTFVVGCASDAVDEVSDDESAVSTAPSQQSILADIREVSLSRGITKGWLLAGIAKVETQLAHCRPRNLYCAGPASRECGGGPVLAGGSDGTCRQGGLGLFQLDHGTQTQTVNAYESQGIDILSVKGNVRGGIAHLLEKMELDGCLPGIEDDAHGIAWLNGIELGSARYDEYTGMLAHCYNGWDVGQPGWKKQKAKYDKGIRDVLELQAQGWWRGP